MSYDVMIVKYVGPPPASPFDSDESVLAPLGAAADVRKQVSRAFNKTDWSDTTWGMFDGDGYSIEFNVGDDDPIQNMMLHLRGGGDALAAVARMAAQCGWSAIDGQSDEFLDLDNPSDEGWKQWQTFRDQVAGENADEE